MTTSEEIPCPVCQSTDLEHFEDNKGREWTYCHECCANVYIESIHYSV